MLNDFFKKCLDNLSSIKFWAWAITTVIFIWTNKLDQYTWVGLTGALIGVGRIFEYFTIKKDTTNEKTN